MKRKVAFICVHNSCRSQIAEALGKKYLSEQYDCYSAGTEVKPQINQDAVRIMKEVYGIKTAAVEKAEVEAEETVEEEPSGFLQKLIHLFGIQ